MKIIHGLDKVKKYKKPVVALGVFDGVHRGHINILSSLVKKARDINGTSVVLTFWPHPQKQESLYSLAHRLRLIGDLGVDVCIVINFNVKFSKITAGNFIKNILVNKIGARFVYIGSNFRFGRAAAGDYNLLKKFGEIYKFKVKRFAIARANGKPISSTIIRRLIKKGDLALSEKLLGRRVSILGSVISGTRLGRRIGFPTANINPHHEVIPRAGIYAAKIIFSSKTYKGICYIGRRPTIDSKNRRLRVEVHIFNFHKNIYGEFLEIQFIKLLRSDKKFTSIEDLTSQIKKDVISCRNLL